MPMKMGRESYQKLIDENLVWLLKQPRTLERDHIEQIVKDSVNFYYGRPDADTERDRQGDDVPRT